MAIGFVIAAGLAGSALATVVVSFAADRLGRRRSLLVLSLLSAIGGLTLAVSPALPLLLMMAFVGMLNGTGTDRSASFALDQAIVPGLVPDSKRTWGLAWYNVLLDGGGSLGALGAGLPILLQRHLAFSVLSSYVRACLEHQQNKRKQLARKLTHSRYEKNPFQGTSDLIRRLEQGD